MKNKGFTLVEMITVIALLAIIGMISIPVVEGVIKRSKDRVYETQLEEIKSGAKKYAVNKMNELFSESKKLVQKNRNIPTYYKEVLLGFITFLEIRDN